MTDESLEMSVPLPADVGGARDTFFHLLAFVAFYTAVISLVLLFFHFINRLLPDPALETYRTPGITALSSICWNRSRPTATETLIRADGNNPRPTEMAELIDVLPQRTMIVRRLDPPRQFSRSGHHHDSPIYRQ